MSVAVGWVNNRENFVGTIATYINSRGYLTEHFVELTDLDLLGKSAMEMNIVVQNVLDRCFPDQAKVRFVFFFLIYKFIYLF